MDYKALRNALVSSNLTQLEFAKILGVTPRSVNLWATGQREIPGPVTAYIRLFQAIPQTFRDLELSLVKEDKKMLKEGMYNLTFEGFEGEGGGTLIFEGGRVYGCDTGGGRYDGQYQFNSQTQNIDSEIKVTIPPNVETVTGFVQPFEWAFDIKFSFPRGNMDTPLKLNTVIGPVNAHIEYMRELPE